MVKNTLTRFALNNVGLGELDDVLNGTTSLATSTEDPIAPIRIINQYAEKLNGKFEIKAAFMDGKVLDADSIASLAKLPSKQGSWRLGSGHHAGSHHQPGDRPKAIAEKDGAPRRDRRIRSGLVTLI